MVVDPRIRGVVRLEDHKTGSLPSITREYLLTLKIDFKYITTIESYSIRLRLFNDYLVSAPKPLFIIILVYLSKGKILTITSITNKIETRKKKERR